MMDMVTLAREDASRAARRLVAADCARAGTGRRCAEAADLMTSEVVTNAMLHGQGAITFAVQAGSLLVRVQVGDDDASRPRLRRIDPAAEGGRGMWIVDALASDWGVLDRPPGKIVWFEVPAQP